MSATMTRTPQQRDVPCCGDCTGRSGDPCRCSPTGFCYPIAMTRQQLAERVIDAARKLRRGPRFSLSRQKCVDDDWREFRYALAAYDAAPEDDGWRPIETAPMYKVCDFWLEWANGCGDGDPLGQSAWAYAQRFRGKYQCWGAPYRATHWRPLAAAPVQR